jgi:hypothetical protein
MLGGGFSFTVTKMQQMGNQHGWAFYKWAAECYQRPFECAKLDDMWQETFKPTAYPDLINLTFVGLAQLLWPPLCLALGVILNLFGLACLGWYWAIIQVIVVAIVCQFGRVGQTIALLPTLILAVCGVCYYWVFPALLMIITWSHVLLMQCFK